MHTHIQLYNISWFGVLYDIEICISTFGPHTWSLTQPELLLHSYHLKKEITIQSLNHDDDDDGSSVIVPQKFCLLLLVMKSFAWAHIIVTFSTTGCVDPPRMGHNVVFLHACLFQNWKRCWKVRVKCSWHVFVSFCILNVKNSINDWPDSSVVRNTSVSKHRLSL